MPTHYKGRPDEVLALNSYIRLVRAFLSVQGQLLPPLQKEFGITDSQLGVLEALHHLGPLSQGQLCEKILRSGSNVTTVVDNLERDKLVRRERDEIDRRVQMVHLTERGRALMERVFPIHVRRLTERMGALSREEQKELGRLCRKLGTGQPS